MAGDIDDRKSTTGVLFKLGDSLISWQSQKQKVVALSSSEAEYIAAATAAVQGVWLARLIGELEGQEPGCALIKVDNKSAKVSARILCFMIAVNILIQSFISSGIVLIRNGWRWNT